MNKPRIFLGSSGKRAKLLQAITRGLADVADVEPCTTTFNPGRSTLDRLVELSHEVDFAAFVFAQDDWTTTDASESGQAAPRDNVVFEAGLFGGALGIRRTFILHAHDSKLPSDLLGLTSVRYDPATSPAEVRAINQKLRKAIETEGRRSPIEGLWWQLSLTVRTEEEPSAVSLLRISRDRDGGLNVAGRSWQEDGTLSARYWSEAAKERRDPAGIFYFWKGERPRHPNAPELEGTGMNCRSRSRMPEMAARRRMQAAGIEAFGGEVQMLELAAPASPAPDELVISVRAAVVANWDEFVRVGEWDVGRRTPLALGVEETGVVAAVGEDVTSFASGDEVLTHPLPLRHQGAWAQLLVAPAALVASKPAAVPWETAAAFPVPALTADQALSEAAPSPAGEWVLVHGAGGVTGGLVVQRAVARGATVVATAGPSSESRVRDYGARVVLDYHDPEWPIRVREASPDRRGVGAAVNAAPGGAALALQAVADHGRLATITGDPPAAERDVTVTDVYVRADGPALAVLATALDEGLLSVDIAAKLPLTEAAAALDGAD